MFRARRARTSLRAVSESVASGLAVLVLVAVAIIAVPQPAQAQETKAPICVPLYLPPARVAELEQQGYVRADMYTALDLENKTGIPLETWLAERKKGREWLEIINDLAKGIKFEACRFSEDGRNLTEAEIWAFMDAGISSTDIGAVGEIIYRYGGDPNELLKQHQAGKDWATIDREVGDRWRQEQQEKVFDTAWAALGGDPKTGMTASGLTKAQAEALAKEGYTLNDVMAADALAYSLHLDFWKIIAEKKKGQTLEEAVREVAKPAAAPPAVSTLAGLPKAVVDALLRDGLTADEIHLADWRAYVLGIDLKQVAADRKPGEKLLAAVDRANSRRTRAERVAAFRRTLPNEEDRVKEFAKKTGKSEAEIRQLRAQHRSWVDITGKKPADGTMDQYDLADMYGITDHILVERATDWGFSVWDVRQAGNIARPLGLTVEEVLVLKTPGNTWSEVIAELSPLPQGGGGRTEPQGSSGRTEPQGSSDQVQSQESDVGTAAGTGTRTGTGVTAPAQSGGAPALHPVRGTWPPTRQRR